ncbi:MAG: NrfD/PsrC family molybdoenzyme membrane anchor subunit [Anaerolineales bacterium]|nr:NrfD/PsrC family molybdoenzyme membrane anchor subunit [Anaerolineales bacterium]
MNSPERERAGNALRIWLAILATVMVVGLVAAAVVFRRGLVVTNLNDLVPWGLWITVDLSSIALSGGAFSLCAGVYLLGLKRYQPLARTATFVGLIGYSMAVMTLLLDVGRPDRFWHPLVFWNPHSVLWEVTMCVVLYMGVLSLETLPLLGEAEWFRGRWPRLAGRLHSVHGLAPYLAVAGLGLSMLHQSSLGATYGVLQSRPIWYRPGLAVLFIVSAIAGGIALTLLATMLVGRLRQESEVRDRIVEPVAQFVGWVLVIYLYLRFWDLFAMTYTHQPGRDEALALLTRGPLSFNFWILEFLLGILVPVILLLRQRTRRRRWVRMVALALVVLGVIAYRWDTTLVGQLVVTNYLPASAQTIYADYQPSLIEYLTTAGVVAYGLLAFTLGVQYLNVVDHRGAVGEEHEPGEAGALVAAGAD